MITNSSIRVTNIETSVELISVMFYAINAINDQILLLLLVLWNKNNIRKKPYIHIGLNIH